METMQETTATVIRPVPPKYWLAIVQAVAGVASTDQARGVITGVRIESDGSDMILTATDSYRLVTVRVPGAAVPGFEAGVTVDAGKLVAAYKAAKGSRVSSLAVDDAGVVTVTGATAGMVDVRSVVPTIDGTYADWRRLVTDDKGWPTEETVSYNPELLAGVMDSLALIGSYADRPKDRPVPRVTVEYLHAGRAARFVTVGPDGVTATGLLMPLRG